MIAMADAIDARDAYTAQHSRRVTDLARRLSEVYGLKPREIERLELAARVHDIGKIGISDQILHKSGPLTDKEWETMREHPAIGEQMLLPYRQFRHQALIVRSHHERWDGRGYPDNLRGQSIPISARIICVADAFDAMTSTRPYRPAMSRTRAIEEIRKNAAIQFDPMVVASFLQVMEEADKIRPITAALDQPGEAEGPWYSSLP
jgi:HD-GYP domain-containing protein (c-di-GMP phosphodiesterase class II)